jgi:endonuclease YncB( thermonuclease family)
MKLHRSLATVIVCLIICISVAAQNTIFYGKVIDVLDGSTIVVKTKTKATFVVKCQATDSPQQGKLAEQSRQRLSDLVLSQTVSVEYAKADEQGRIVGTIFLNGDNVCLDQLRSGLLSFNQEGGQGLTASTRDVYAASEVRARANGLGLWTIPNGIGADGSIRATPQSSSASSLTQQRATASSSSSNGAVVDVDSYFRKDGTFVRGHKRTTPDGNVDNNWSTVGNVNPYTGKPGTKSWFSRNWWIIPTVGALIGTGFLVRKYGGSGIGILCNDGWVSHAQNRQGACSHHGGIQ